MYIVKIHYFEMEEYLMEKNCVAGFYIHLTSNASAIPLPESVLLNFVRTFRYFKRAKALDVLFRLKYGTLETKKVCLSWFAQKGINEGNTFYIDNPASQVINFTDEQFGLLADELQFQYQAEDPCFLDIHSIRGLPNGCQKELEVLQKKMSKDPLLFFMAVKKCVKARKNPEVSQLVMELLSNNPASAILALKKLGFDFQYRVCLKAFSSEIGALLLSMRQIYVKRQKLFNSQDMFVLPIIALLKQIIELDIQISMSFQKDALQKKYHHSKKVAMFENDVLKFIELSSNVTSDSNFVSTFTEYRQKLEFLGKALISFLEAQIEYHKIFSEEKNEDILFIAATDINLSKKMCSVQQECNSSKTAYYTALKDFQNFFIEHFEAK